MKEYYDARAPEYDDWYLGTGRYAGPDRPGFDEELRAVERILDELPPCRVLDVACGTGFFTRRLQGDVTGLDQSPAMLALARIQAPDATFVEAEALALPFPDRSFDRVVTGHFFGHLRSPERRRFLAEARRVASELVILDSGPWECPGEHDEERLAPDGSAHLVYKRYFTPETLLAELGGGRVLDAGRWFVAVAL